MPNPTSKLNLVINGATTQLDIHDANAVDLSSNQTVGGDKEFTGTTTAHDLVPSATDTYNFGSPSYQWNNAYIKSLTINGVACGDILTHNASEFVGVTGNQTIAGVKTFNDGVVGNVTGNGALTLQSASGTSKIYLRNNNTSNYPSSVNLYSKVGDNPEYGVFLHGNTFYPNIDSMMDLGKPTSKWKSFNGVNPGALSLPSISSSGANAWIAIDTTDWVKSLATSNAQKYMPPADGWLNVRVDNAVALGLALTAGGNYMHQMVRSETPSGLALLLPVFKNKEVAILVGGNENLAYNKATFYPCQGNV